MSVAPPSIHLHNLVHNGLQYARVRLEILELELIEERQRLSSMMTRGLLFSLAGLLSAQFIGLLVMAAFWDTRWRLHAIGGLIALALAITLSAWFALRQLRRDPARPLSSAMHDIGRAVAPEPP